jgi:hypothetical protein
VHVPLTLLVVAFQVFQELFAILALQGIM